MAKSDLLRWMTEIRERLHREPECAYGEVKTAALVRETLEAAGYACRSGVGGTGVVAFAGNAKGRVAGFRADMDALEMEEEETPRNRRYRSRVPGKMHGCGHDAHVAAMLGVARTLAADGGALSAGGFKFFFQPAEEGGAGALAMIEDGALRKPAPDVIFAGHVSPELPAGHVGFTRGLGCASADCFTLVVRGRGGHAARPNDAIDPVVAACSLVLSLQTVVSRSVDPIRPAVLTVGMIAGGTRTNIIPDAVTLKGTLRAHDAATRALLLERFRAVAKGNDATYGTTSVAEFEPGYPALVHDDRANDFLHRVAVDLLGASKVHWQEPSMGGEDFAFFAERAPATMVRIGVANRRLGIAHPLHSGRFDIDPRALETARALFSEAGKRFVSKGFDA